MLLVTALASLAGLAALLAVPVDLRFHADSEEDPRARLRVEWLYGRVGRDLGTRKKPRGPRRLPSIERLAPLWQEAFRDGVARLLRRCRPWLDVHEIEGRLRLGLGDPAETGTAIGLLQPLLAALRGLPRVDVRLEPDFTAARLAGDLHGGVRAVPIGLVRPVVLFALSPATIRTVWRLRSRPS